MRQPATGRAGMRAALLRWAVALSLLGGHMLPASAQTDQTPAAPATASDRSDTLPDQTGFPRRYEAIYHDDAKLEHAGTLSVTADGKLTIVAAEPRFANTLDVAVRSMNDMPAQSERVPPPDEAQRRTLVSRLIPRGSPEFIPAMIAKLRASYQLELRPNATP